MTTFDDGGFTWSASRRRVRYTFFKGGGQKGSE